MKELLEELKTIDPACYEDIRRRVIYAMDEDFKLYVTNQTFRENVDDTIQGACQRACVARGWPMVIGFDCDPDNPKMYEVDICGGEVDGLLGKARAKSPAKAILTAYLEARKAQP
jgi:hypothetical protein